MDTYLIIDIGTGNVRVALTNTQGAIFWVEKENVIYKKDKKSEDGLYFDPKFLWKQITGLIKKAVSSHKDINILAAVASSQREGIVLLDKKGESLIGFPNHDHRGRAIENSLKDKDEIYKKTGRYPSSLFSALKLAAYREAYPENWKKVDSFLSISDWAQYKLSGVKAYEHAQASETLLYDVEEKQWSQGLFDIFSLDKNLVPPLYYAGEKLGDIRKTYLNEWNLSKSFPVLVGGADTQLAVKSTRPDRGDVVIVSGTTTPIVKITSSYVLDKKQRSWTNSHLNKGEYILETNCGVTGLNYQRFKDIFYPNEPYSVIEDEIDQLNEVSCFANLGSLLADEREVVTRGGYLFDVPIMTQLSRADFAFATLWDIACSIKKNYDTLIDIEHSAKDYIWGCGGGFQSQHLRKFVAGLLGKKLLIRPGYNQASVSGAAVVCEEALNKNRKGGSDNIEFVEPKPSEKYLEWYHKWEETRNNLLKINN